MQTEELLSSRQQRETITTQGQELLMTTQGNKDIEEVTEINSPTSK
jgi:hypothetical protein